ncbi:hypothetical protein ACQX2I_11800 [Corynebacterium diphtheriae]
MPGPVPKRSDQRRRRNKDTTGLHIVKDLPATAKAKPPRVSPNWHPLMKDWFRSLKESGQSAFYEPSDWQTARLLAEVMSQELRALNQRRRTPTFSSKTDERAGRETSASWAK